MPLYTAFDRPPPGYGNLYRMTSRHGTEALAPHAREGLFLTTIDDLPSPGPDWVGLVLRERGTGAIIFAGYAPKHRVTQAMLDAGWDFFREHGDPIEASGQPHSAGPSLRLLG
jgi:hypothetical protein